MSGEANQALELDELKALCAAATEGPWYQSPDALWHVRTVLENALIPLALKDGEPVADATLDADAAFIAAARSAVPVLIAEVERLRAQRDEARADLYGLLGAIDGFRDCCAGGSQIGERELLDLRRDLVRVLSRTEDGNQ